MIAWQNYKISVHLISWMTCSTVFAEPSTQPLTHSLTHSLTLTHSLSLTHSLTHFHSLSHSFARFTLHSLIPLFNLWKTYINLNYTSRFNSYRAVNTYQQQDQDPAAGMWYLDPDPARKLSTNLYDINHCCVYSEKLLMIGRGTVRNM
jgi:hypothetical protein